MIKQFLSSLLLTIESKLSRHIKENFFRNVFLYPLFLFLLQLPILTNKHLFYGSVLGSIAVLSLIGYFMALKVRLICQIEYPMMLLLIIIATLMSYLGFFIHDEVYNYMFLLSSIVGLIIVMNILMIFTGNTRKILNHYIEQKYLNAYTVSDLEVLAKIMLTERIIVRHIFISFKDLYRSYLPNSGLYIGIDYRVQEIEKTNYCRIADNYELNNGYSLLDLIRHIKEEDVDITTFSKDDFEVFMMKRY